MAILNRCIFLATSSGTGDFVELAAILGYQTMESAGAVNGIVYGYAAQSSDLTQWEYGEGTYSGPTTPTLQRTTVVGNSLGTTAKISFTNPPQVMLSPLASDIGAFIPANGNLSFYVATTGSDNNPGTSALPFATIQHAINVLSNYDWQNTWGPTINVAAGTYTEADTISGPFRNLQFDVIITGSGTSTCNWNGSLQIINVTVKVGGFNFGNNGGSNCLNPIENATVVVGGDLSFSGNLSPIPFECEGLSCLVILGAHTITITTTEIYSFALLGPGSFQTTGTPSIVLPAALTVDDAFFDISGGDASFLALGSISYTNFGGVTGANLKAGNGAVISTPNGAASDIPGSTGGAIDGTVVFQTSTKLGTYMNFNAGIPTTSQVPTNCWSVWKDTSGGGVYVVANDAGTIKKVALT